MLTIQDIAIVDFVKAVDGSENLLLENMRLIYIDSGESYDLFVSRKAWIKELIATGFGTVLWKMPVEGNKTKTDDVDIDIPHVFKSIKGYYNTNRALYFFVRNKINNMYAHILRILFRNTLKVDDALELDSPTSAPSHHEIATPGTVMTETNNYEPDNIMDFNQSTVKSGTIKDCLRQSLSKGSVSEVELDNIIAMIRAEVLSEVTKKLDFSSTLAMDSGDNLMAVTKNLNFDCLLDTSALTRERDCHA